MVLQSGSDTKTQLTVGQRDALKERRRTADLDVLHKDRGRVKNRKKGIMDAQGTYPLARWAKRWDYVTAGYLAYCVSYSGTQKDPHGWIYKSAEEMFEETGITPDQQKRCRKLLSGDEVGVIEAQRKGIGNKWNVRVNFPVLELWDEWDEKVLVEDEPEPEVHSGEKPEPLGVNAESFRDHAESFRGIPQTQNNEHAANTHQYPTTRVVVEEKPPRPAPSRVERCMGVLRGMKFSEKDEQRLPSILADFIAECPKGFDAKIPCQKAREHVGTQAPVKAAKAMLSYYFANEREEFKPSPYANMTDWTGVAEREREAEERREGVPKASGNARQHSMTNGATVALFERGGQEKRR